MKQFTNDMCQQRGLSVAEKGKDFYGKDLEEGHVIAWSKDKYHLLANEAKESHVKEGVLRQKASVALCIRRIELACAALYSRLEKEQIDLIEELNKSRYSSIALIMIEENIRQEK